MGLPGSPAAAFTAGYFTRPGGRERRRTCRRWQSPMGRDATFPVADGRGRRYGQERSMACSTAFMRMLAVTNSSISLIIASASAR